MNSCEHNPKLAAVSADQAPTEHAGDTRPQMVPLLPFTSTRPPELPRNISVAYLAYVIAAPSTIQHPRWSQAKPGKKPARGDTAPFHESQWTTQQTVQGRPQLSLYRHSVTLRHGLRGLVPRDLAG